MSSSGPLFCKIKNQYDRDLVVTSELRFTNIDDICSHLKKVLTNGLTKVEILIERPRALTWVPSREARGKETRDTIQGEGGGVPEGAPLHLRDQNTAALKGGGSGFCDLRQGAVRRDGA